MKTIIYYLLLLVFIALLSGFLIQQQSSTMAMGPMIVASVLLVGYVVGMSLVGEERPVDEREVAHRYQASRYALVAGSALLSLGVIVQLFSHKMDYWLLAALVVINLTKIISLIYLNYKR